MTPRSDYTEPAGIPREMLQDTLIDVMAENDRLRARIAELEAALRWFTDSGNYPDIPDIDYGYQTSRARRALNHEEKP